ncbi:MAG: hypothetical protein A2X18_08365 [Bacteroidetes bacterium GWF2_40_14]|nr:MAG: hypothetical protein A2X18_08365 [Bacteroidetes bacterium GWF2_40_14]
MTDSLKCCYLTSAYLPPIEYIRLISRSETAIIEKFEKYQKQSYRSRCHIYSANGILPLIIPVSRDNGHSVSISEIKIDYTKKWQKQHWRAIVSAYKNSPFFEYYQDDIVPFYNEQEESLFDFNYKVLETILNLIGMDYKLRTTESFLNTYPVNDYRELIHPKRETTLYANENGRYHQVFAHKHGFIQNLSILDLLFNEGPDAISYL